MKECVLVGGEHARRTRTLGMAAIGLGVLCALTAGCGREARSTVVGQPRETWEIFTIDGQKIGFNHQEVTPIERAGESLVKISARQELTVIRFRQATTQRNECSAIETPEGQLREFEHELYQGANPVTTKGRVAGDKLELEVRTLGKVEKSSLRWSSDYYGPYGEEGSLLRKPMQPKEKRTLKVFAAGLNTVATVKLQARDYELTSLRGPQVELLRIESESMMPDGLTLEATYWCDRNGEILKRRINAFGIESYRATEADAREKPSEVSFDLGLDTAVKPSQPLKLGHKSQQVRYRVKLKQRDPAAIFPNGGSQMVRSIDPHTAELTVYALRPGREGNAKAPADQPASEDLKPNSFLQSDDAKVIARAKEAAADGLSSWETAVALEKYVHKVMKKQDFTVAMATAAEVAANPTGDCTEYAMLLAAMARARGIPARVAVGLVYIGPSHGFGFHMWTEVYVDKQWIPLDATLGLGGIGAGHIKVSHSNMAGASAYTSILPVVEVARQLEIVVEEER